MLFIRPYKDTDKELWDSYVLNHPQGTFFHLIGWKNVIERTFGHRSFYLIAVAPGSEGTSAPQHRSTDTDSSNSSNPIDSINPINSSNSSNHVVGLLPLFSVKSFLFSKAAVSVPFGAYGGILSDNPEVAGEMLKKAKEMTQSKGLDYLELRNRDVTMADLSVKDLYVRFRREIYQELNDNMEAIPRKSRRMVRVGEKEGLKHEFGQRELIPAFYEIFAQSYHRLGSPVFPKKFVENLLAEFRENSNVLLVKTREEKPIASVLTFYYKDEVLPYYAGSLFEYRNLAPNDYMYWQLVKYGWEKGYKLFDFGRSKVNTGSYDFKRHWGFEPEPLPYQFFLNRVREIPNISPANPKYQKKIEMWQKMPFWATKIIGPHIVKYIP